MQEKYQEKQKKFFFSECEGPTLARVVYTAEQSEDSYPALGRAAPLHAVETILKLEMWANAQRDGRI